MITWFARWKKICVTAAVGMLAGCQAAPQTQVPAQRDRVKELQDMKFGMFICWSFSTFSDREWTRGVKDVSFFNPTGMDTDQWARVAKQAEMNYILFLTKHHDGFCLWDTQTTDWKVTRSPLGKDVLAAVRRSCDKYGLKLALYFSEGDWTWIDPGEMPAPTDTKNPVWKQSRNPEMKKAQLKELLTRYGPIEFMWMDHAIGDGGLSHVETAAFVKKLQPDCFVGFNHGQVAGDLRVGELGRPGPLEDPEAAGPYAPRDGTGYLVAEFCMPILGIPRWFYTNPGNDDRCMSAEEIYRLYRGAVRYGNLFSLNVAPDRAGRLRPIDVKTLQEVGAMIRAGRSAGACREKRRSRQAAWMFPASGCPITWPM